MTVTERTAGYAAVAGAGLLAGALALVRLGGVGLAFADPGAAVGVTRAQPALGSGAAALAIAADLLGLVYIPSMARRLRAAGVPVADAFFLFAAFGYGLDASARLLGALAGAYLAGSDGPIGPVLDALQDIMAMVSSRLNGISTFALGASAVLTGWAILSTRARPRLAGWLSLGVPVALVAYAIVRGDLLVLCCSSLRVAGVALALVSGGLVLISPASDSASCSSQGHS